MSHALEQDELDVREDGVVSPMLLKLARAMHAPLIRALQEHGTMDESDESESSGEASLPDEDAPLPA